MIIIRGTGKIKGALDLGGINKQLITGSSLPITDKEFVDHSVQVALKMGFLTYEKEEFIDGDNDVNTLIKVKNVYDRPLSINLLEGDIRPGQVFTLSEDQINTSDIRGALAKGYLEIISKVTIQEETEESNVNVGDFFSEEEEEEEEEPISYSKENENKESIHLETNEEAVNPSVINTEDPKPITKEDISDPKGKTIVWNPNKDPITRIPSQMKSVMADGSGEVSPLAEETVDIGEINFVDAELDEKRRESHPILKNVHDNKKDGELDFLDT